MKKVFFIIIEYVISFVFCFLFIYLPTLGGLWNLFESGNQVLVEIGVSLILSIFMVIILEIFKIQNKKIESLEKRINELENK